MAQRGIPRGGVGWRWVLPVVLALVVAAIVAGAFFATHPHIFGRSATATPTVTATAVPTATPHATATRTATPGPTATPRPGPTGTPKPGPTGTPKAGPSPTPSGPKLGSVSYSRSRVSAIQQQANQGNPAYTYYLNPFKVVRNDLPKYGFNAGSINILSPPPPPQPTPTAYTNAQGLPEVKIKVQYQGKRYIVVLDQPVQKGPAGIWVITNIGTG